MLLEKKKKVKKGWMAVEVGLEEELEDGNKATKFVIPISYLYHSLLNQLLEMAHQVYGYHTTGPLRLPCSTDEFLHLRWRIEKEHTSSRYHHHQRIPSSLSFHSCWVNISIYIIKSYMIIISSSLEYQIKFSWMYLENLHRW